MYGETPAKQGIYPLSGRKQAIANIKKRKVKDVYTNYGDKNFFEHGILVDYEHSDTSVDIIWCMPYCDEDDAFQFAECQVDTTDSWLEKDAVMNYIGMTTDTFDLVQYAIGCIEYYGIENFSSPYDGYKHDKAYIENILKYRLIASDNLDITW